MKWFDRVHAYLYIHGDPFNFFIKKKCWGLKKIFFDKDIEGPDQKIVIKVSYVVWNLD